MKKPISIYLCAIASMVMILTACEQVQDGNNKQEDVQQDSAEYQSAELAGTDNGNEERTQRQSAEDTLGLVLPIPCIEAARMIDAYRDNSPPLLGKYSNPTYTEGVDATVTRDPASGEITDVSIDEDRSLYSWHIPQADINQVQGSSYSGMRVYPGLEKATVRINLIPSGIHYHVYTYNTLVCFGTTLDATGNHQNDNSKIFQYFPPCPEQCEHAHAREPGPCL